MDVICREKKGGGDNWVIKIFGGGTSNILSPNAKSVGGGTCLIRINKSLLTNLH